MAVTSQITESAQTVDLTHLPLGDGRLSSEPKIGYIWPCRVDPNAGGAFTDGPWLDTVKGTYNFKAKAVVDGSVSWPSSFTVALAGNERIFTSNDLPNHATGTFPIASSDDAFRYDRNPNRIQAQIMHIALPATPTLAAQPSCTPGAVGILLTGSALFNALDAPGRDAVAHETQDACQGHPQNTGAYHYHNVTTCLPDTTTPDGHSTLVGYALDGFGIFGKRDVGGAVLTSADLDVCHGHTHEIDWNGQRVVMYHYHATWDFPYSIGCMRGSYKMADVMVVSGTPNGNTAQAQTQTQKQGSPDLATAARKLGISEQALREALGPPPPDLAAAAKKLGISEATLREALGAP